MAEKRYTDGTLAKWYYSQTDVISDGNNEYYLNSKTQVIDFDYTTLLGTNDLLDYLNKLEDENEQLEKVKMDVANSLGECIDENEKLKKENNELKIMIEGYEDLHDEKDTALSHQSKSLKKLKAENEQLKKLIKKSVVERLLDNFEYNCKELAKKNEQLKHQVNCLQDQLDDFILVEKENEQLK